MSDFKYIIGQVKRDTDFPPRQFAIGMLTRVLRGQLYDHIRFPFSQENTGPNNSGDYIPIRDRRPSTRHNLCRVVVDDSVSLLFSEGHFPAVEIDDEAARDTIAAIIKESKLNALMIDAATKGSVGSVAIRLRVLSNRLFFDALTTEYLTPIWRDDMPDTLAKVVQRYKVTGSQLVAAGYEGIEDDGTEYWLEVEWDTVGETAFYPYEVKKDAKDIKRRVDDQRSAKHNLGVVPIVWVKNLPGGDAIDGEPTFPPEAIDTQIEIDYQLSQAGRGLKYSSDPLLMIKEPTGDGIIKGGGNAVIVNEDGDAKLLEISGSAANAVIEYCKHLRENALELMHGNKASNEKIASAQSGRAMELMNQALIWLADRLRISYGEGALLQLLKLIVLASQKYKLEVAGERITPLPELPLTLRWPDWYPPTFTDRQAMATTLQTHTASGHMSRETAVKTIASDYDIEDVPAELAQIEKEMAFDAELNAASKPLQQQKGM